MPLNNYKLKWNSPQMFAYKLLTVKYDPRLTYTALCVYQVENMSKRPDLEDVKEGQGDGEEAEKEVRDGNIGDEDVLSGEQHLKTFNGVNEVNVLIGKICPSWE